MACGPVMLRLHHEITHTCGNHRARVESPCVLQRWRVSANAGLRLTSLLALLCIALPACVEKPATGLRFWRQHGTRSNVRRGQRENLATKRPIRFACGMLFLTSLITLAACASEKTVRWKEEVQLSDGRVILVQRTMHMIPGGGEWLRSSGWRADWYEMQFELPDSGARPILWRSVPRRPARDPELPLVLDVQTGNTPIVWTIQWVTDACTEYTMYSYSGGSWNVVPLPNLIPDRPANLFLRLRTDLQGTIQLQEKQAQVSTSRSPARYRTIGPKRVVCGY